MAALGAALSGLIVLNYFRSSEEGNATPDLASRPSSTSGPTRQDERLAAEPPAHDDRGSPSPAQVPDATVAAGGDAPAESVPVLLPNQVPATPMAQALEDRQIPPGPLLETEREFAAQSRDPVWSTATEAHVLGQIAGIAGLELASLDVECRQTLCRLHFVTPGTVPARPNVTAPAPNRAAPSSWGIVEIVNLTGLKARWVMAVRDRNGSPVSLAYLERGETADTAADAPAPPAQ